MLSEIESRLTGLLEAKDRETKEMAEQIRHLVALLQSVQDQLNELASALADLRNQLSP